MPDKPITEFYDSDSFLLIGMSKKRKNFAWGIYKSFTGAGKKVFPLHIEGGEKDGAKFYSSLEDLPEKPDACIVSADLKKDGVFVSKLADWGIKRFWFQQGSYDKELLEVVRKRNIVAITGCVLMYLPESSFPHKIHRFFHELFTKGRD
ncbi:MAG: CoA-binding protein [Candidatus Zixiibacteriota bacterium]|nr:MAG: CoA-binding protein [candidate division Zixibacteria bacterium]